jgi:glycogen debranching enzyme
MKRLIDQAYLKAIEVLKINSTESGFKASFEYYNSVWARDGAITLLGAMLTEDKELQETSRKTLETLKEFQTPLGQIPNVFFLDKKTCKYYATDATLWWIIGIYQYFISTMDKKFLNEFWPSIKKAILNIKYQVMDKSGLIDSPEASDWMDSSIGRRGKVFYNNCLYFKALECVNQLSKISGERKFENLEDLKKRINLLFWPQEEGKKILYTWNPKFFEEAINPWREHYVNYLSFEYCENRCDVFASLLAVLFKIADETKKEKILNYLEKKHISSPYPIKVINPPVFYPNPTWNPKVDLYREEEYWNLPYRYHNAGIWPFVGGFYILTLIRDGQKRKAGEELEKLATANKLGKKGEWEFNEWLHGKNGKPMGAILQSWSAAGYVIAYKAVIENKLIW